MMWRKNEKQKVCLWDKRRENENNVWETRWLENEEHKGDWDRNDRKVKRKDFERDEVTVERKTKTSVTGVTEKWKIKSVWQMKWRENEKQNGCLWEK
jgi:hypothetical protein